MKTLQLAAATMLAAHLMNGCGGSKLAESPEPIPLPTKTVAEKLSAIEQYNDLDPWALMNGKMRVTMEQRTVYYLISTDGFTLKCDLAFYARTKTNDSVQGEWSSK